MVTQVAGDFFRFFFISFPSSLASPFLPYLTGVSREEQQISINPHLCRTSPQKKGDLPLKKNVNGVNCWVDSKSKRRRLPGIASDVVKVLVEDRLLLSKVCRLEETPRRRRRPRDRNACRTTKFAPVKSLRFSELFLGILLSEFRFTVFFPLGSGFMDPPLSVFSNRERKSPPKGLGRSLERMRHQCNFSAPP